MSFISIIFFVLFIAAFILQGFIMDKAKIPFEFDLAISVTTIICCCFTICCSYCYYWTIYF